MKSIVPREYLVRKIYVIRGHKVMIDEDLARLYGASVKRLNEQVKRNKTRFPSDFMFQLNQSETNSLRSQNATLKIGRQGKHRKYFPYVFTEQGVAMLSSVLKSRKAIQVNVAIMRAFVSLREMVSTHKKLAEKLSELEGKVGEHDQKIRNIFEAIYDLMTPGKIGFKT